MTVCDIAEFHAAHWEGPTLDCSQRRFAMAHCCSPLQLRRGPAGASFVEAFTAAPASAFETPFASRGKAAVSEGMLCIPKGCLMQHEHP